MKRKDNKWIETHRIKEKFIGLYDTFQSHILIKDGKSYLFVQTLE